MTAGGAAPNGVTGRDLARRLGIWGAVGIVVGNVLGSGIFVAPGEVARAVPSPALGLVAWLLGGVLSLVGALVFAELGAAWPATGGAYVYLRRAFGARLAFVFGWAELCVIKPTGAAGIAVIFAQAASPLVHLPARAVAAAALVLVYALNLRSLVASSRLQFFLTAVKFAAFGTLAALALVRLPPAPAAPASGLASQAPWALALVSILWAYDGWSDVNYVAGEVRQPERRLPASLVLGTCLVTTLYLAVAWAVQTRLDPTSIAADPAVLPTLARRLWGTGGGRAATALLLVSTFGSLLAGAITTPRIFYAMARDRLFFRRLGGVHPRFGTPDAAIVTICTLAVVFVLTGTFVQIVTYFVVVMWLFYVLTGVALFRLRAREPATPRPYRVPGYPVTPALFVLASTAMLAGVGIGAWRQSLVGLGIVALGLPAYDLWRRYGGESSGAAG